MTPKELLDPRLLLLHEIAGRTQTANSPGAYHDGCLSLVAREAAISYSSQITGS
jgi:hypothetical protein